MNFFTKNYYNKRELELDCSFLEYMIMEPDTIKLGNIFDLHYSNIHSTSFYLIIIYIVFYSFSLSIILLVVLGKLFNFLEHFVELISKLSFFILLAIGILLFCYNLILVSSYYNSNNAYFLNFLKCPNVNFDEFKKYYESAKKCKSDIITYITILIFHLIYRNCFSEYISQL